MYSIQGCRSRSGRPGNRLTNIYKNKYKLLLQNGNLCFFGYFAQPMFNLPDQNPAASYTPA